MGDTSAPCSDWILFLHQEHVPLDGILQNETERRNLPQGLGYAHTEDCQDNGHWQGSHIH